MAGLALDDDAADMRTAYAATDGQAAEVRGAAAGAATMLRILTCGSVDDGKSTLIGRLLWDAAELPEDTRATIAASAGPDGVPDVSLLLDGLEAERAQGITIDIAWRYFDVARRRYVIIDCPGHEQYTRNMATGASQAEVAIMLVDARQGIKRQTRRHAAILALVGIRDVVLVVNKMDLVDWSQHRFEDIAREFAAVAEAAGIERAIAIPAAARLGDNVARSSDRMTWFDGPTLVEALDRLSAVRDQSARPFRFPVQTILRDGRDFRGLAGTVASGRIRRGDEVIEVTSGRRARIARIATFDGDRESAQAGQAVVIGLAADLDIARGGVLAAPDKPAALARDVAARIVWLADDPPGSSGLLLRTSTDLVPLASFAVEARLDLDRLERVPSRTCSANDIADVRIGLGRAVAVDRFADNPATGHFLLIDALSGATVAGGVVSSIASAAQGARKTTFRLSKALLASTVCADLPATEASRLEFRRRASEVAFLLSAAGVSVDLEDFDDGPLEQAGSGI